MSIQSPLLSVLRKTLKRVGAYASQTITYRGPTSLSATQRDFWEQNGYLVLPQFFSAKQIENLNQEVENLWTRRAWKGNPLTIDVYVGEARERRIYFRDATDDAKNFVYKLNDVFLESGEILELITDAKLCLLLADLLEGDPIVCNSLNLERGSQQDFHFDTFFMPPPVENKMLATWIALEDVSLSAGPLQYYPGSHKIPPYRFSHGGLSAVTSEMPEFKKYIETEIKQRKLQPAQFAPRLGDVLIWHPQLFHGGAEIKNNSLTRKSLVTHYFRAVDVFPWKRKSLSQGRHVMNKAHQKAQDC